MVYDQRGTGGAVPSLECPAVDEAFVAALQADRSYTAERDAIAAARDECLAALEADGVDLTDYHSEASAADLDELRQALGYEQWNLLGSQLWRPADAGDDAFVPRRDPRRDPRVRLRRHLRWPGGRGWRASNAPFAGWPTGAPPIRVVSTAHGDLNVKYESCAGGTTTSRSPSTSTWVTATGRSSS